MAFTFDHDMYGFKIKDLFVGDLEAEPHCSVVLKLNNIQKINEDIYELTRGIPIEGNIELLEDIKNSCIIAIEKLQNINRKFIDTYQKK